MPTIIFKGKGNGFETFQYTQSEREGKVQGSAEFRVYASLAAARDNGVTEADFLAALNFQLKDRAVKQAAGVANSDGLRTQKMIDADIAETVKAMAAGKIDAQAGNKALIALIAEKAEKKAKR